MKRLLALFLLCGSAYGQITNITVVSDGNRVIRTNFTMPFGQVTFGGSGTNAVPVAAGGTGATNASEAMVNLLPSYTGNSNRVLSLNSNATTLVWSTNTGASGSSIVNLADTTNGVTNILSIANGGTGSNSLIGAQRALGIFHPTYTNTIAIGGTATNTNIVVIGVGAAARGQGAVVIGANATNNGVGSDAIIIGNNAFGYSIAIGERATNEATGGVTIGRRARVTTSRSIAIGEDAVVLGGMADSVQIGDGTNNNSNSVFGADQISFQWGTNNVAEVQWQMLASATTIGGKFMSAPTNSDSNQVVMVNSSTNLVWTNMRQHLFPNTTTNLPTNTNAPSPNAWIDLIVGTNTFKIPLWQ